MEYLPLAEVCGQLEVPALDRNAIPLEAFIIIKAMQEDGTIVWYSKSTQGLNDVETLGALHMVLASQEQDVIGSFEADT